MNITVGVFGAGISGLTIADELSKRGYTVHLFEKENNIGGLARSSNSNKKIPTEISWRGIGPFYHNMLAKLKGIPYLDKSVFDYGITQPMQFKVLKENSVLTLTETFSLSDKAVLGFLIYNFKKANEETRAKWIPNLASDYLKTKITYSAWLSLMSTLAPFLGIDSSKCSMYQFLHFYSISMLSDYSPKYEKINLRNCEGLLDKDCGLWSLFGGGTKNIFFDPWKEKLKKQNVIIHNNSKLIKLKYSNSKIKSALINNKEWKFDYYFIALSPFAVLEVLKETKKNAYLNELLYNYKMLTADGPHIQVPFTIAFKNKIKMERYAYVFEESPYNITLYFQSDTWEETSFMYNDYSFWSGTACVSYERGLLYDKPLIYLTKQEFFKEIEYQISQSATFNFIVKKLNYRDFAWYVENKKTKMDTWHTFSFFKGGIQSSENKWVNSTRNEKYRPTVETEFENLAFTGSHTKTSMSLYSMESAVESGLLASNYFLRQQQREDLCKIYTH